MFVNCSRDRCGFKCFLEFDHFSTVYWCKLGSFLWLMSSIRHLDIREYTLKEACIHKHLDIQVFTCLGCSCRWQLQMWKKKVIKIRS